MWPAQVAPGQKRGSRPAGKKEANEVTSEAEGSTSVRSEADGSSHSGYVPLKGDRSVAAVVRGIQKSFIS